MLDLRILDVVVLLNCNLNCRGCNNFCDHNVAGIRSLENLKQDFINWKTKINPSRVQIMGGEALLHKNIYEVIYAAREHFPNTDLRLFTNGLLLNKHKELVKVLQDTNCMLVISVHSKEPKYLNFLSDSVHSIFKGSFKNSETKSLVSYGTVYEKEGVTIEFRDMTNHWYQTYKNGVTPYQDNDPKKSWEACYFKYCTQLYDGKLWKCSQIAYLEPLMSRINNTESWEKYRNIYKALDYDGSDKDFLDFRTNLNREEFICNMCPANPEMLRSKSVW